MKTKRAARPLSWWWFFLFALLFSAQVLPRLTEDSPAADEPIDMADGFYYWKGDVVSLAEHPPLAKGLQALPLWVMSPQTQSSVHFTSRIQRDFHFLFAMNGGHWRDFLAASRMVTFIFGLGLGCLLFAAAHRESRIFAILVVALWAFEPTMLAFSGLALADIPMTFFFTAAVLAFRKAQEKPGARQSAWVGFWAASAIFAKLSAVFLVPILMILEWVGFLSKRGKALGRLREAAARWAWGLGAALTWVFVIYLPGTIAIPGHAWPFHYAWGAFRALSETFGWPVYYRGQLAAHPFGSYNLVSFILKSPLPFLGLLVCALVLALGRKIKIPAWQWVPPLVFFSIVAPVYDHGIKNLLPIYPFCFLAAARAGEWMWNRRPGGSRVFPILLAGLISFQALSVGLCFPSQISYFNELVPQDRKIYWLGDSNLDIGQDTKRLAEEAQRRGWTHVKLAYLGIADPAWYGMAWRPWTQMDLRGPQPGWVYAINAEFIQLGPAFVPAAPEILGGWILKVPPTGRVGDTWYYLEMPGAAGPDSSPAIASAPRFNQYDGSH